MRVYQENKNTRIKISHGLPSPCVLERLTPVGLTVNISLTLAHIKADQVKTFSPLTDFEEKLTTGVVVSSQASHKAPGYNSL